MNHDKSFGIIVGAKGGEVGPREARLDRVIW